MILEEMKLTSNPENLEQIEHDYKDYHSEKKRIEELSREIQ